MFSLQQKRAISEAVQKVLRETNHPELPEGEINFLLHVDGAQAWSWADIRNNGAVNNPGINPWNEAMDRDQNLRQQQQATHKSSWTRSENMTSKQLEALKVYIRAVAREVVEEALNRDSLCEGAFRSGVEKALDEVFLFQQDPYNDQKIQYHKE